MFDIFYLLTYPFRFLLVVYSFMLACTVLYVTITRGKEMNFPFFSVGLVGDIYLFI